VVETADHFEKAKDDILRRTAANGGPKPLDILEALQGLADDMDEKHDEVVGIVNKHLKEALVRDDRIGKMEAKIARQEEHCPGVIENAINEAVKRSKSEHSETHKAYVASMATPRRKDDAKAKDYRKEREESRQVWLMWMVGSKVSYIIIAVLITALNLGIHYLLMGEP
jgi:hemerythrin